jgi:hypothetical protein
MSWTAAAREFQIKKQVDPGALLTQLRAAGFSVTSMTCSLGRCTVVLPDSEKKDPAAVVKNYVFVDPATLREKKQSEMRALYGKWQAGTITPDEKDSLFKYVAAQALGL